MKGFELKNVVLESGYTQAVFAEKIGVSVKTLQNWINKEELSDKSIYIVKNAVQKNLINVDVDNFPELNKNIVLNDSRTEYISLKEMEELRKENSDLKSEIDRIKFEQEKITKELFSCKDELIAILKKNKS
jgi:transcriptional regulator with XRE-family HTH domain